MNYRYTFFKVLLTFSLSSLSFCTTPQKPLPDLKSTVDGIVTRLYQEIPADSLNLLDKDFF